MSYFRDLKREEIEGILKAHSETVTGQLRRIVVQRKNVWRSAFNFWKLPTVAGCSGVILCKFSGELDCAEPSADRGGPRREFFELLLPSIVRDSGLFSAGVLYLVILDKSKLNTGRLICPPIILLSRFLSIFCIHLLPSCDAAAALLWLQLGVEQSSGCGSILVGKSKKGLLAFMNTLLAVTLILDGPSCNVGSPII